MRRILVSLLATLFSFSLIVPLLLANSPQNLPACCRRNGKHHCAMGRGNRNAGHEDRYLSPDVLYSLKRLIEASSRSDNAPPPAGLAGGCVPASHALPPDLNFRCDSPLADSALKRGPPSSFR